MWVRCVPFEGQLELAGTEIDGLDVCCYPSTRVRSGDTTIELLYILSL